MPELSQLMDVELISFLLGPKSNPGSGFMKTLYDSETDDTSGLQEEMTQDITPS